MSTSSVRRVVAAVLTTIAVTASALVAAPAFAAPDLDGVAGAAPGVTTEATIVEMRLTSGLFGGDVASATPQTPYPSGGLTNQRSVTTAQIVLDDPNAAGRQDLVTYCIDLGTETEVGVHYELGDWSTEILPPDAQPYVQWILTNYFPQVPTAPAGTDAEKVRAVQGALWYFTDQFVVSRFYPEERAAVKAIVDAAQAAVAGGAPPTPSLPTLTVDPASREGAVPGELIGPFVVGGSVAQSTIDIFDGAEVFSADDPALPVADGATISSGTSLWVRYDPDIAPDGFAVSAAPTVVAGNVFVYDQGNPPRTTAQKLVLAAPAVVPLRASGEVVPAPVTTGTLTVDLTVDGAAAGRQGAIDLLATCTLGGDTHAFPATVPAGVTGSHQVATIPNLPAGTDCVLTQPDAGENAFATLSGPPAITQPSPIVAGGTSAGSVVDTYVAPVVTGSLEVSATFQGAAAGDQSDIQLVVTCSDPSTTFSRVLTGGAGATGTVVLGAVSDIPVGTSCAAVQTADGSNADAALQSSAFVPPGPVVIAAGANALAIVDTYAVPVPATGTLRIDARITGAAAGQQSAVSLAVSCTVDGATTPYAASVPAGTTGSIVAATFPSVEAESVCTLAQTTDGANARAVLSSSSVTPPSTVVPPGGLAALALANAYALPAPPPTPTPTPTPTSTPAPLPPTGGADLTAWGVGGFALLIAGALAVLVSLRVRRRSL
ncbi:thioester domain-containing protein [Microbacterium sp. RD1]|uniref:thioester domain-containing protein n=1 Tax=Microbacterium sp. RD1 TaxID=3457313 RepID=UPI003FA58915